MLSRRHLIYNVARDVLASYAPNRSAACLRPPDLLAARSAHRGRTDRSRGASLARGRRHPSTPSHASAMIGIDVYVDGEMRRASWLTEMADAVDGFEADSVLLEWHGPGGGVEKTTAKIVGSRLQQAADADGARGAAAEGDWRRAVQDHAAGAVELRADRIQAGVTDRHYKDRDELLGDLVAIVRDEVQWLVGAGRHATSSSTRRSTRTTSIRSTATRCGRRAAIRTRTSRPPSPATTPRWRMSA